MVTTLDREQKRSEPLMRPGNDGAKFVGCVPVMSGELSMKLCPLYLCEIGKQTFLRKLREQSFDKQDLHHVAKFLVRHGVQPNKDNAFRLMFGARLDLLLEDRLGPVERRACYGQT